MKVRLMHPEQDLELGRPLPPNADALAQDLELPTLFDAMARDDRYLRELVETVLLAGPAADPDAIRYRQRILADCLEHPALVRQLYDLVVEGVESKRRARVFWFRDTPEALLQKSITMLGLLTDVLRRMRRLVEEQRDAFASDGLSRLVAMLERELADDYLDTVEAHLRELGFRRGALISAELGPGNRGTSYVLREPRARSLRDRLVPGARTSYGFTLPARDEHGLRTLADLRNRGVNLVADALAQSTDHVLGFFTVLRAELGFYVACLNLHEQLAEKGQPTCFPEPLGEAEATLEARALVDVALAFHLDAPVVGNDVDARGKRLLVVTGANQGGKSTFLRSVGLAQLMLRAGMFVAAESFRASVAPGVFTHFKREEDASMTRGKLDEELARMSEIADLVSPHALLLCNESFAATNEREGSEIARQVLRAMVRAEVTVVFVTHLFDLAHDLHEQRLETALFLRAERLADGRRTFRVVPGEPEPTSYGADSFARVFGDPAQDARRATRA